jgi:hypothetical protein
MARKRRAKGDFARIGASIADNAKDFGDHANDIPGVTRKGKNIKRKRKYRGAW